MSVIDRANRIYEKDGMKTLVSRSFNHAIWSVLPEEKVKKTIAKSPLLTALYFYSHRSFYHEQKSILHGQADYVEKEIQREDPEHRVIRNTHKLEKGLSMKDRRAVFGEGYIQDLVSTTQAAWKRRSEKNREQLQWTIDVLSHYFEIVDETPKIKEARSEFEDFLDDIDYEASDSTPYPRDDLDSPPVTYGELQALARTRTSTRWFEQREVPRELLDKAMAVAAESPSACNRQSFEFRIYDDEDILHELRKLPLGVTGYAENIPCLIVIVGKRHAYQKDRDKNIIHVDASLAAMAFQFALETLGLASCCINWPAIPEKKSRLRDLLNLKESEEAIMFMAVGYPDSEGMIPYSAKKDVTSLRSYNEI